MTCPHCGEEVPPKAKVCPHCGSCEETGWSEAARASGLGLPDEDFDYEEFTQREFGNADATKPRGVSWFWWMVGVVVLVIFWMVLLRW